MQQAAGSTGNGSARSVNGPALSQSRPAARALRLSLRKAERCRASWSMYSVRPGSIVCSQGPAHGLQGLELALLSL